MGKLTKENAIPELVHCAELYRNELANRKLLFFGTAKSNKKVHCIEVGFRPANFMHLTGARHPKGSNQSATSFYKKCINHRLSPEDFIIPDNGTMRVKLNVLPGILNGSISAKMIGDYCSSRPQFYADKLIGGNRACLGVTLYSEKKEQKHKPVCYTPTSTLRTSMKQMICNQLRVVAVFRKNWEAREYAEVTYRADGVEWEVLKIPAEHSYLKSMLID